MNLTLPLDGPQKAWKLLNAQAPDLACFGYAEHRAEARFLSVLGPQESAQYHQFPTDKRRRDWLMGRRAAKHALGPYLDLKGTEIKIENDACGAPYTEAGNQKRHLSITHSHGEAFAMHAQNGAFGLDLEALKPRSRGTLRFYLRPSERPPFEKLSGAALDRAAVAAWCLKEAAFKALRPARGAALIDVEIQAEPAAFFGPVPIPIRFFGALEDQRKTLGLADNARALIIDRAQSLLALLYIPAS